MYYTRPRHLILSLVCLTGSLLAADPAVQPPPTVTEQVTQAAIKEAVNQIKEALAHETPAQVAVAPVIPVPVPVVAPPATPTAATRMANTSADALAFLVDRAKAYSGKIEDGVSKAVDYGMKEVPQVITEFLRWRFWMHLMHALTSIIFGLIGMILLYLGITRGWKTSDFHPWVIGTIIGGFMTLIATIGFFAGPPNGPSGLDHIMSCIQIGVAPRIYLIESISRLMGH